MIEDKERTRVCGDCEQVIYLNESHKCKTYNNKPVEAKIKWLDQTKEE